MAELIFFIKDRPLSGDPIRDAGIYRCGDVVIARDDGWSWGRIELIDPQWRIIRLPNVPLALASTLEAPEPVTDPRAPNRTLHQRWHKLLFDSLFVSDEHKQFLEDDTRQTPVLTLEHVDADLFRQCFEKKTPVPDPSVVI